jgi:hypothetical protein
MSLDPEELRIAQGTFRQVVLEFFKLHRFSALSADEVFFELGMIGVVTTRELLDVELRHWTERQRLFSGLRDGEIYYWYDNRLGYPTTR